MCEEKHVYTFVGKQFSIKVPEEMSGKDEQEKKAIKGWIKIWIIKYLLF